MNKLSETQKVMLIICSKCGKKFEANEIKYYKNKHLCDSCYWEEAVTKPNKRITLIFIVMVIISIAFFYWFTKDYVQI